jgi:mannosyl-3-phosphoglycerate phosphatase
MEKDPISGKTSTPLIVIFTDLDGTLLDNDSYGWEGATPALNLCRRLHVPLILVSSKTRAEMDVIRNKLGLTYPFVSENGGGIFFPGEGPYEAPSGTVFASGIWKWSLGLPYEFLVKRLQEIRDELGWNIRGFSEMSLEEIAHLTGLDQETSRLAAMREFDEPFMVMDQETVDEDILYKAARRKDLNITHGGRFYHLQGKNDKGVAVEKVISWYKEYQPNALSIALGDSPNDFSMLKRVNHPVLIRSSRHFPGIEEMIPDLRITQEMGPKGWNSAIMDILGKRVKGGIS